MAEPSDVSAVVLAAGMSSRMGENKLLLPWKGSTVVRAVVEMLVPFAFRELLVVTGHQAERVRDALAGMPVRFVLNAKFEKGLSSSIGAGIETADPAAKGYLLCLGDMPWLSPTTIGSLLGELNCPTCAIVPRRGERWGNPVLFGRAFRTDLQDLKGDSGARRLLEAYPGSTKFLELESELELEDLDTPEDYRSGSM